MRLNEDSLLPLAVETLSQRLTLPQPQKKSTVLRISERDTREGDEDSSWNISTGNGLCFDRVVVPKLRKRS